MSKTYHNLSCLNEPDILITTKTKSIFLTVSVILTKKPGMNNKGGMIAGSTTLVTKKSKQRFTNLPWENWAFSNLQLWLCQQYLHRYQMQCSRRWNLSQSPKVQLITLGPFSQTLWPVHWFFTCPTMITCTLLETPLLNINPFIH